MMTDMEFLQILSGIDENLLVQADRPTPFCQKRGFKIALIAAVLAFALLITSLAGAFALAIGHFLQQDDIKNPSEPQAPTQDDIQQNVMPGGLVGKLFGDIDWGGLKEAIGNDGNVNWDAVLDVLLGNDKPDPKPEPENTDDVYSLTMLDDGTFKLEKFSGFDDQSILVIPEEINGAKITVIGQGALAYNEDVTGVIIPNSVTVIESGAFSSCPNLFSVEMPDSVQEIGAGAFEKCTSLDKINLPEHLQNLGEAAFAGCNNLQLISLPEGLTEIGRDAFAGTAITTMTIPSTVKTMGDVLFAGCESLETVLFAGDAPEISFFESSTGLDPNTACKIYYLLGADGFSASEWYGHPCELMQVQTEQYVLKQFKRKRYTKVPMYNVELLGGLDLSGLDEVTVLDSYQEYEAFSHVLTSERYDRDYFKQFAIVLIKVTHTSSEKILGLAGMGAQLYTTAGIYYLELCPVVKIDAPEDTQTDDKQYTYILAEVQRSDIRTDDVTRVGSVYAYDIHTQGSSAYLPGLDIGK